MNASPSSPSAGRPSAPLWIAILGGVALSFASFLLARQQETLRAESEFVRRADLYSAAMQGSLSRHLEILRSLQRLMQLSPVVNRNEFHGWATEIIAERPEIQVLEWCPRISADRRATFEANVSRNQPGPFSITEQGSNRVMRAASRRDEYFPVLFFEPARGNEILSGFDVVTGVASNELLQARDTGLAVASERVRLLQDVGEHFGLILTLPVYKLGPVPNTLEQRRESFVGCVRGVFRMHDLFRAAWRGVPLAGVETLVLDASARSPANRLVIYDGVGGETDMGAATEQSFRSSRLHEARLGVGGRTWSILFRPTPGWWESQFSWMPHFILAGGLGATLILAGYLRSSLRRTDVIEQTVSERTADLKRANDLLQREVGERRRAEGELSKAQATLVRAQHIGQVGSWEADLETGELAWSAETFRIFGRDPELFRPTSAAFYASIHLADRERVERQVRAAVESGVRYDSEHRVLRADGSECFVHEMAEIVRDEHGRARRMIGTVQDITERHHADERLELERNLLRTVIDHVPDYIFFKDREGRFVMSNLASQRLLGVRAVEEILGRTEADFLPLEVAMIYMAADARIVETGQPIVNQEEPLITREGERRHLLTTKIPLKDARGQVTGIVGVSRDITDRKNAEDGRQLMERKFRETQKLESLGVLAGGIAHDFNNLLTGILGNASLARMQLPLDSDLHSYLEQIENSSQRAADLCRQMLAYSGKGRFVIQRIDLSSLVRETLHLLQLSISKKAVLELQLTEDLATVMGDATQFRQIIMNLVMNASEALGEKSGRITVSTKGTQMDRMALAGFIGGEYLMPGQYVLLEVADNGIGMTEETMGRIFEPFFTTKFTGRGLGLAAVLGIVRGHQGALKVRSQPGLGATFQLLLPAAGAPTGDTKLERRPAAAWRGHGTVLVIDDEEAVRMVASKMLKAFGFDVITANDGEQGVHAYRIHADALRAVLCDLTMPRKDGEETFREIRAMDGDACVILMSGFNEQEAAARFVGKGLAGFLQKPFTPDELRERLAAFLRTDAKP